MTFIPNTVILCLFPFVGVQPQCDMEGQSARITVGPCQSKLLLILEQSSEVQNTFGFVIEANTVKLANICIPASASKDG